MDNNGMEGALRAVMAPPAMLLGLDTVGAAMKDEALRLFLGHALLREIVPCQPVPRQEAAKQAAALCETLEREKADEPLREDATVTKWKTYVLPLVKGYEAMEFELPPCLCFSLAALVMHFAGLRQEDGEYRDAQGGGAPKEPEEILLAFSALSCDMPPESLAYAVLADRELWGEDLRDVPGLEDRLTDLLRDLQLLGLGAAMEKSWHENYAGKE